MKIFIDESGDHNLSLEGLDNQYNIFVLGAFCINEPDYIHFEREFNLLKVDLFGSDDFIIHTAEITRPNRSLDSRNNFFNDPVFRKKFYTSMNSLIERTSFEFITCIIRKNTFVEKY